jgi:hypothetical protein
MSLPYIISGICYDTDGTTPLASIKVTVRNERTNQTGTATTNPSGQYAIDLANLTDGYSASDIITIFVLYSNSEDYEEHVVVSGGAGATVDLTLVDVPASDSLKYFTVQNFYDHFNLLVGAEDTPLTNQVVLIGSQVEKDIDETCQSEFSVATNTVTNEYHEVTSEFQKDWFLEKTPVVSVTTLEINTAADGNADSWETITEAAYQFEVDLDTGRITLTGTIDDETTPAYPAKGTKNLRATYVYGRSAVPRDIRKLAILMTGKDLMQGSVARALFRGQDSFKTDHYMVLDKEIERILARHRKYEMRNT